TPEHLLPNQNKTAGKLAGPLRQPPIERSRPKPVAALNLPGMQRERPFRATAIYPDKFVSRLRTGRDLEQPFRRSGQLQTDFLAQFPNGTLVISFAGVQVAGRRRIPRAGKAVLLHRSLPQKQFAAR